MALFWPEGGYAHACNNSFSNFKYLEDDEDCCLSGFRPIIIGISLLGSSKLN